MVPAPIKDIEVITLNLPTRDKKITWTLPNDPTILGYDVYRSEVSYADYEKINVGLIPATENEFIDNKVPVTAPLPFEWWYKVVATGTGGMGSLAATLPSPAQNIRFFVDPPATVTVPESLSEQDLTQVATAEGGNCAGGIPCADNPPGGTFPVGGGGLQQLPTTTVNPRWFLQIRQRAKWALEMGGIPVILLKHRWSGTLCPNFDPVRGQHKQISSPSIVDTCYNTNFVNGYHTPIQILVSFTNPALKSVSRKSAGMWMEIEPKSWSLWEPNLLDRDVIVRADTGERFELLNVTKTMWRGMVLRQTFDLKIVEPTNIIYRIPIP